MRLPLPNRSFIFVLALATGCSVGQVDTGEGAGADGELTLPPWLRVPKLPVFTPTAVTASDGASGIHPGTATWDDAAGLPAGQRVRPMAPSKRLRPTPFLVTTENETNTFDLSRFPEFTMPAGIVSGYDAPSNVVTWKRRAELQVEIMKKGFSHGESMVFMTSGNDDSAAFDPPMTVGKDTPYSRRIRFVTQNFFEDSPASHDWIYGDLPTEAQVPGILADAVRACDDSKGYEDGKASQICILDLETWPKNPADLKPWSHVKRLMIDAVKAARGQGPFAADHQVQVAGVFYDADLGGNGQGEDLVDEVGYYKMSLWSGTDAAANYADPATYRKLVEFWTKQGSWATQIVSHHEYLGNQQGVAPRSMLSWIAPYHEDVMPYMDADPARFMRYYKLRPDVAEGTPIWIFLGGARGYTLWNDMHKAPWVSSEEAFIRGNWRVAQHPDMFGDGAQPVVPEISFDGGTTWRRQRQGAEWVKPGDNLSWTLTSVDQQTKGFVQPLNAQQEGLVFNHDEIDPVRVLVRALVKNGKILVAAQDAWQEDPTATRDIVIRYNGFVDTVRLYGREIALAEASLTAE